MAVEALMWVALFTVAIALILAAYRQGARHARLEAFVQCQTWSAEATRQHPVWHYLTVAQAIRIVGARIGGDVAITSPRAHRRLAVSATTSRQGGRSA